jgi:hypothetical protein
MRSTSRRYGEPVTVGGVWGYVVALVRSLGVSGVAWRPPLSDTVAGGGHYVVPAWALHQNTEDATAPRVAPSVHVLRVFRA